MWGGWAGRLAPPRAGADGRLTSVTWWVLAETYGPHSLSVILPTLLTNFSASAWIAFNDIQVDVLCTEERPRALDTVLTTVKQKKRCLCLARSSSAPRGCSFCQGDP